jgi:hypothetical protein
MSRPDWNIAPEWAKYCAMDEDGEWYWFEKKPIPGKRYWCDDGAGLVVYTQVDGLAWHESLERRPSK